MSTERRLHAPKLPPEGGDVALDAEASRHVSVLRLVVGDAVTLFDGSGLRAAGVLVSVGVGAAVVRTEPPSAADATSCGITLVQCMPRGGKLDDLVRAATELGVDAIHLATSAHAVSKGDDERWERRKERLLRIVREAARQSERDAVPKLEAPRPLLEHAALAPESATRLVLCGRTGSKLVAVSAEKPAWLVVGPEGGLSAAELSALAKAGFQATTLGPSILRVETAVVAAISAVKQARSQG